MHKYYSRSPQELQEYIEKNRGKRKKNWVQIMILIDIVILVFIFFMVFRVYNSGSKKNNSSNKIRIESLILYYTKSRDSNQDFITYFLFVENTDKKEYIFPQTDLDINFYLKARDGTICYHKQIALNPKTIIPNSTEFYTFNIQTSNIPPLPEVCKKVLVREKGIQAYREMITNPNSNVDAIINFKKKKELFTLKIQNERWY